MYLSLKKINLNRACNRLTPIANYAICIAAAISLLGCAAAGTIATVANVAMEVTGVRKAGVPDAQKPPKEVKLSILAEDLLNATKDGQSLALVVKVYKLKQHAAFEQASYESFLSPEREKAALGNDLLESKEIVLIPKQHYTITEKVSVEAPYIGVVALFHAPNAQPWRATFATNSAEKLGINLNVSACAMLVNAEDARAQAAFQNSRNMRCY